MDAKEASKMFPTTIAGSLPKPGWLAETHKLWPRWRT
jgi:5-methyltetrahydropteroyltriglutamate--homocysteine methyltransferase